jgi:hypothetical protein
MFAGGVDIALAGARVTAARPARPRLRLHTLTMAATNRRGRPDTGDGVFVINADNPLRFDDPVEAFNVFDHGIAKFSVPAGHYWAIGDFLSFTGTGGAERLAVLPQFTVRHSRTVPLSERSATSKIGFTTARPATLQLTGFTMIRGSAKGRTATFGFFDSGLSLWVSPTSRRPTVGTLRSFTAGQLTSSRNGNNVAYAYNLHYAGPDGIIPPRQHHDATPGSLATVTDRYVQDVRSRVSGGFRRLPGRTSGAALCRRVSVLATDQAGPVLHGEPLPGLVGVLRGVRILPSVRRRAVRCFPRIRRWPAARRGLERLPAAPGSPTSSC